MYKRVINFDSILERKSLFLFGPRQTGKSTLLKLRYPEALYINLLLSSQFQNFSSKPSRLREAVRYFLENSKGNKIVVIDEIQKIPELLDEVHNLIEEHHDLRFILTGSSARKLKRGGGNLLGGRASWLSLHPICYPELDKREEWINRCLYGFLPSILKSSSPWEDLKDYVGLYLKEEVQAEGLTRSINNFSRFLEFAATTNAEQINYTSLAHDAQLSPTTVSSYYQILEDTLIGESLPAFLSTKKRKAMTTAKFYLFDCGVANALLSRKAMAQNSSEFGKSFEQAVFMELRAYLNYNRADKKLEYWRSTSRFEVDFLIYDSHENIVGIEAKSNKNPSKKDFRGLEAFSEDFKLKRKIIVCTADLARKTEEGVEILPVHQFLDQLWKGQII